VGRAVVTPVARAREYLRRNARSLGIEVLVNGVLPFVAYSATRSRLGDVGALLVSTVAPIAWSIVEFVRRRRIDGISILIVAGIALSLLAFIGGGSVRFLQLRENLVTGLVGLVFLGSAAVGKPLIYHLARAGMSRRSAADAQAFESRRNNVYFQRSMRLMTIVWGAGFLLQTLAACVLVFRMPIGAYLAVSPFLGYGTIGALALWTVWYGEAKKREGAGYAAAKLE
jgi:hypothetical protein